MTEGFLDSTGRIANALGNLAGKAASGLPDALRNAQGALQGSGQGSAIDLSKVSKAGQKMLLNDGLITQNQVDEYNKPKASKDIRPKVQEAQKGAVYINPKMVDAKDRPVVQITKDNIEQAQELGMDVQIGDYMSLASRSFADDNGNEILITPIRQNGSMLWSDELEEYKDNLMDGDIKDIAKRDPDNLVIAVFNDGDPDKSAKHADLYGTLLHDYQAAENSEVHREGTEGGEFVAQAAEPDTTNLSKDELVSMLGEVDRVLAATQSEGMTSQRKAKEKKFTDERTKIVDALKQLGMSDADIQAALGPQMYNDAGEPVLTKQQQIDQINQKLHNLSQNIPTDPVELQRRNEQVKGLYAQLAELDAGPKLSAATGEEKEVKTWHAPKSLEELRTAVLDWSSDVSKKPFWGLGEVVQKMFEPAKLEMYQRIEDYHTKTGSYPVTDADWQAIREVEAQTAQAGADNAMTVARTYWDDKLPVETPRLAKEILSYISVAAPVISDRTSAAFARVGQSTADLIVSAQAYSNRNKYADELGKGYTIDQARTVDPVLDAAMQSSEFWQAETRNLTPSYEKSLGGGFDTLMSFYDVAMDQVVMSSVGERLASGVNTVVKSIVNNAVPYFERLPASIQKISAIAQKPVDVLIGKPVGFLARNVHYELRAYSDYANEARQMGKSEEEVHQYGLLGMFTNGLTEGFLGDMYEKAGELGFKALMPKAVKGIFNKLAANKKSIFEFLGYTLKMAAGESAEEVSEAAIQGLGRENILHTPQSWQSIPDTINNFFAGRGFNPESGTMAADMVNSAVQAFGGSLMSVLMLSFGGASGSVGNERQAEHIVSKILTDPKAAQYVQEATAISAQKGVKPMDIMTDEAPAQTDTLGNVPPESAEAPAKPHELAKPQPKESIPAAEKPVQEAPVEPARKPPVAPASSPRKVSMEEWKAENKKFDDGSHPRRRKGRRPSCRPHRDLCSRRDCGR
jgi:hypothetical protein